MPIHRAWHMQQLSHQRVKVTYDEPALKRINLMLSNEKMKSRMMSSFVDSRVNGRIHKRNCFNCRRG